jgi:predicted ATPase/signal transduction histidine kinase
MMNISIYLPGYRIIELIHTSSRTLVYRGLRDGDDKPVVIKFLNNQYPNFNELVQFRNQYTIAKNLEFSGIVQPYNLESYGNSYALVMEDFGGISFQEWMQGNPLDMSEFLYIAEKIVSIIDQLHRQHVIHKDIKPANILINPSTLEVKLIDFSLASLLPRETQEIQNPNILEGTLAYLSPEQTGRMNRGIDYRSDFYSLGVTFFQLLTGQLPFICDDAMELVHCHIAKSPPQLSDINPSLPPVLSAIVGKLMAKNAEDRYQSALGLKYDLLLCCNHWQAKGNISNFHVGMRDICDRFVIPEKLYGREAEVASLLAAFARVTEGNTEMMLVAGFSGIGKTVVVNEVHKPIVQQRGYFIKGKFDQLQRNIPFSALVQALRDLMGQLLSESDEQIAQWKAEILAALGENGQAIADVIPELECIIGKQPALPKLSGSAAQNRFNLLFQKFIQVFTTPHHPLVIFLDDLQWADSASLKLIQLLMSEAEQKYLLLLGAYRDNEVSATHPLMLTLDELRHIQLNTIYLNPLNFTDLNYLIADTLTCSPELAQPLTKLVYNKTQGNPFFSNQFLKSLYEDGLIIFNSDIGYWQSDISQVQALSLNDDVVEFMALQLQKLPLVTQEILQLAACIGNQFDLATLAIISEKSPAETSANLWKALQEGLILPKSEIYKFYQNDLELNNKDWGIEVKISSPSPIYRFLHDRVQQAAYFLIPEQTKQATHLRIGQLLLNNTQEVEQSEKIFEIVNQLNYGVDLITEQSQRDKLAQLNLIAGKKAKTSTAYDTAVKCFAIGRQLLTNSSWQYDYNLILNLYIESTEAAYLNGNFVQMDELVNIVNQQAKTLLDRIKVSEIQIVACSVQSQFIEAVKIGLLVLNQLGVNLPESPQASDITQGLTEISKKLGGRPIENLIELPSMIDPNHQAAMQLLATVSSAAYLANPQLMFLIIFKMVELSIEHGNAPESAVGYSYYGLILCGFFQDIETGYKFGQLALNLLENLNIKNFQSKVLTLNYTFIQHWQDHIKYSLQPLLEGYKSGMETGDLEYAGYCVNAHHFNSFYIGEELGELTREMANYTNVYLSIKQQVAQNHFNIHFQTALNLLNQATEPCELIGSAYNEQLMLPKHQSDNESITIGFLYINKMMLAYLFYEYNQAKENAAIAEKYLIYLTGLTHIPLFHFYDSLTQLALYKTSTKPEQDDILAKVQINQDKMEKWAYYAPNNYLHKFYLVEAERHRINNEYAIAIEYYDQAIALAQENEYINEEALAYELAGKFYLEWGKEKIAQIYIIDAYYAYARWGSSAKIHDLEKRYPQLLLSILKPQNISLKNDQSIVSLHSETVTASSTSGAKLLEWATIMKAYQAISSEIELEKLLATLMQVVIANSGAQIGVLLMWQQDNLVIAATGNMENEKAHILQTISLSECRNVPCSTINYVQRTQKTLVINNISEDRRFANDPYIIHNQPKSVLCTPILNQGKIIGILYLENRLTLGAFTSDRIEILNLLCSQAAICLENARLYQQSQESLENLQQMQLQLVQSEKMSALGNLVAGVAHEINNPVGFIAGNLQPAVDYVKDLLHIIDLYQHYYPQPVEEITAEIATVDLEYIRADLPKLISSMREGVQRIRGISTSLRTFSRADSDRKVFCNIHDGIDSTILILKHRLKANETRPEIIVVRDYGNLPPIECFSGQLNQVFMNLLANAIDALEEFNASRSLDEMMANPNQITIQTRLTEDKNHVLIKIKDNGIGMSNQVKQKIFDHLYTTKAVGQGTGLGLSITRQIILEKHGGMLEVNSVLGQGAEFIITIPVQSEILT